MRNYIAAVLVVVASSCIALREEPAQLEGSNRVAHLQEGWLYPDTVGFHGNAVREKEWNLGECQKCHGQDFQGDPGRESCQMCHAQKDVKRSEMPHLAPGSCLKCHTDRLDSCNGCHGSGRLGAPPPDLDGYWGRERIGVGAHEAHLAGAEFTAPLSCRDCHAGPYAGHYETDLPAEVVFSEKAGRGGKLSPEWNRSSATCSSIYCHGDHYEDEGRTTRWAWTDASADAKCGDCHGLPPAKGHSATLMDCVVCHAKTVDEENNIADKSLHINGLVDLFAEEEE